jgi:predicted transcriptional regulator YdeE
MHKKDGMEIIEKEEIKLIGLALPEKTANANGQAAVDCGNHWQKFEQGKYADKVTGKLSDDIYAVYHDYEGDHTTPYSYFIGCPVTDDAIIPDGMNSLVIPKGTYVKIIARGIMPDCIAHAWMDIWKSDLNRAYLADFEVYDEKSKDWSAAEVQVYVGVKG